MLLIPGVYRVVGNKGCNSYVIETKGGLVVIDVGFLGSERAIKRYIEMQVGASTDDIIYVVLTHAHRDVAEALPDLLAYCPNARVIIHEEEVGLLRRISRAVEYMDLTKIREDREVKDAGIKIISTPGHTPGSISILYDSSIFVGDLLYVSSSGLELPKQNYDKTMLIESLKKIALLAPNAMFPAHGRPITKGAKQKLDEFIKTLISKQST